MLGCRVRVRKMRPTADHRRQPSSAGCRIVGVLAALLLPGVTRAQTTSLPVGLLWRAAVPCSSQQEVLAEVERTLAGAQGVQVPVAAQADIDKTDAGGWRARLRVDGRGGHNERQLEAVSCGEIVSAVALIIAVIVDGGVVPEAPMLVAAPRANSVAAPVADVAVPARWTSGLVANGAVVGADGVMPMGWYPGAELAFGWTGSRDAALRVRVLMALGYFPTGQVTIAGTDRGGEFWRISAAPRACVSLTRGRFDIGPCLGGELAMMRASGRGPAGTFEATTTKDWSVAATVGALSSWALSARWSVFLRAEALFPFGRSMFVVNPGGTVVYETSAIAGRVGTGLEWRFP